MKHNGFNLLLSFGALIVCKNISIKESISKISHFERFLTFFYKP